MKALTKIAIALTVLFVVVLAFDSITVYSITFGPPQFQPIEVRSQDGLAVFRWEADEARGVPVADRTGRIGVYNRYDKLIYAIEDLPAFYVFEGNFAFSFDMRHIVFIPVTDQVVAMAFFKDGVLTRSYRIDELVRDMSTTLFVSTVIGWEFWHLRHFDSDSNRLTIVTRDDITYIFDISSGEIVYDTAHNRRVVPLIYDDIRNAELPLWARVQNGGLGAAVDANVSHADDDDVEYAQDEEEDEDLTIEIRLDLPLRLLRPDLNLVIDAPTPIIVAPISDATLSEWAVIPVSAAVLSWGLVPEQLASNFNRPITRAEFAELVIRTYSVFMGGVMGSDDVAALERELAERMLAFTDTNEIHVMLAAYLGIITGVGDGRFDPDSPLTREQAALILSRLVNIVLENPIQELLHIDFNDANDISYWAADAVPKMQQMGIMSGVGENNFAPQGIYTREQSIVTMLRVFDLWHYGMLAR